MQNQGVPQLQGYGNGGPGVGGNQQGVVSCYLCGKVGHYARNCWTAGNGRPMVSRQRAQSEGMVDGETREMREYFREKITKWRMDEERREMEEKERRRREEEDRKEQERLREAEAKEARLEARLVRLLAQHSKGGTKLESSGVKKKSSKTKARVLREIRSYLDESDDESEKVKEEAGKLIEAIGRRKGKKKINEKEGRVLSIQRRGHKANPIRIDEEEERTPPLVRTTEDEDMANPGILDFAIELHRHLSEKKVPELRKLCNREGIEWSKKDTVIGELVKCKAKLAYGEFVENGRISPLFESGIGDPGVVESSLIKKYSPSLNTHGMRKEGRRVRKRPGKRERGRRKVNVLGGRLIKFNGRASLIDLLQEMKGRMGIQQISSTGGSIWMDKWKVIRGKVGETTLVVGQEFKSIEECKQVMEKGGMFQVRAIRFMSSEIEDRKFVLRDVLRQRWTVRELYKKSFRELVALYRTATLFSEKKSRNQIKCILYRVVKGKYGSEIRRRPCVKVPFSPELKLGVIRRVAAQLIVRAMADPDVAKFVATRERVVVRRRLTVGSIIHNQWKCAENDVALCTCDGFHLPRSEGHVKLRVCDVKDVPEFMRNSKNVTSGSVISPEVLETCIREGVNGWVSGRDTDVPYGDISECYGRRSDMAEMAMTTNEVRMCFKRYSDLVAVPIDRNPGDTLLVCLVLYLQACKETFNWSQSFRVVHEPENQAIARIKTGFLGKGLSKVARWQTGGKIGQAYVLPKD
ncbi:hypothetical protein CBR_g26212 [Chara braunii]|uniref:CCHC-type domain-containing protein n=1 Tax=Chara braunii TaxID=69332 RepID=A0A388L798_CHABU|nr:hypothetical protein CBR_g26212 [Chara braunii]|eukprot:GBG78179.1 hypothetical protein CBR_g26212 [Chara braunii]